MQTDVVINASSSKVWQVLTDFEAYPQWNPFIRHMSGSARPGGQLTIGLNLSGSTITIQPTVLVVQPEKELRWIGRLFIPGVFDGEHSFIIEAAGCEPGAFCSERDLQRGSGAVFGNHTQVTLSAVFRR